MTRTGLLAKVSAVFLALAIIFTGSFIPNNNTAQAATTSTANRIIAMGHRYLGVNYQYGAPTNTTRVFDCSSFTKYLFQKQGIYLPRTSRDQAKRGVYVSRNNLRKGDLVFFWTTQSGKGRIGHVGIYTGDGHILHTYKRGVGVTYSKLNSSYWSSHYVTARRVIR